MRWPSIVLAVIVACAGCARRTTVEAIIHADGSVIVDGSALSDQQIRDFAAARFHRQGTFSVIVRADDSVPQRRMMEVRDNFRIWGARCIAVGDSHPGTPVLLYPTPETWTNEWKWHGLFTDDGRAIQTNAGVNVRLRAKDGLVDGRLVPFGPIVSELAALRNTDRCRVLITVEPAAQHGQLMAILRACHENQLDTTVIEPREAKPPAGGGGPTPPQP